MKKLEELGEDGLIEALCAGLPTRADVVLGPGDDCAVVKVGEGLSLLKTDAVVAGVHFVPAEDPRRVGWKAVARVLSDFGAMGGEPGELLITIALAPDVTVKWVEDLYEGIKSCLGKYGGVIVGGETTSLPPGAPTMISVAGRGVVEEDHLVTRSGGKPGDHIYVTGRLGGSLRGKHLDFAPRLKEARWLVRSFKISAMMDLSDGLMKDLPRLLRMSGVSAEMARGEIPRSEGVSLSEALGDGEDYELLFTSPDIIEPRWQEEFPGLELTRIGRLVEGDSQIDGEAESGWDHFRR